MKTSRYQTSFSALATLLGLLPFSAQAFTQAQIDQAVHQIMDPAMNPPAPTKHPVALVVGVLTRDGIRAVYGFGSTTLGGSVVPDGNTLFEVASITKTFTATLLAQEVVAGTIALDTPIDTTPCTASTVSAFCRKGVASTFLNLATHTAGLPDAPGTPGYMLDDYSRQDIDTYMAKYQLTKTPGTAYAYSNLGFGYLADLISDREGKTYNDLIAENITGPLGLSNTSVILSADQQARMNMGYSAGFTTGPDFAPEPLYQFSDTSGLAGAAAVHSSVNDLLTYLSAEMRINSSPLSTKMAAAMDLSQVSRFSHAPDTRPLAVGLGWELLANYDVIFHSGALPGYDSFAGFDRTAGLGVVVLTDTSFYINGVGYDQATDLGMKLLFNLLGIPTSALPGGLIYNVPASAIENTLPLGGV